MAPSARPSKALVKEEKKGDDVVEAPAYSADNVQHNMKIIYYSRTFLSIVGGVVAGVLGLSAIAGFLCYFIIMLLVSGAIAAKTKFDVLSYFDSWQRITVDGITAGFMSFVLFWTYPYNFILVALVVYYGYSAIHRFQFSHTCKDQVDTIFLTFFPQLIVSFPQLLNVRRKHC